MSGQQPVRCPVIGRQTQVVVLDDGPVKITTRASVPTVLDGDSRYVANIEEDALKSLAMSTTSIGEQAVEDTKLVGASPEADRLPLSAGGSHATNGRRDDQLVQQRSYHDQHVDEWLGQLW